MKRNSPFSVPAKANRILHLVLVALALLLVRIWYLTIVDYDQRIETAQRPTRKSVLEPARRATIRDRFNYPLAINQIQYNVAINYSSLRTIPSTVWETSPEGKRVKRNRRKEYIKTLANWLSQELNIDADRIEDLIHAKASFYDHIPFVIQQDINEQQYYRLKMREPEWIGLEAQRTAKRHYPLGSVAGDIIGYMGAINRSEYDAIINERNNLRTFLEVREIDENVALPEGVLSAQDARDRLRDLEEKAYSINDFVGKTGIEGLYEQELRGFHGSRLFYADSQGNTLRELPGGRPPIPGKRLLLTLSAELQAYAEQLLMKNEQIRTPRVTKPYLVEAYATAPKTPWIKGGAIIALDPNTGEILAMASHPRLNPNDFVPSGCENKDREKRAHIRRWFEADSYVGELWDSIRPLERETGQGAVEQQWVTWGHYLNTVLDTDGEVYKALSQLHSLGQAIALQNAVENLLTLTHDGSLCMILNTLYQGEGHISQTCRIPGAEKERILDILYTHQEEIDKLKRVLDPHLNPLKHTYDKLLFLDLCRLAVCSRCISPTLLPEIQNQTLASYNETRQASLLVSHALRNEVRPLFHNCEFVTWRQQNETPFLKEKRAEEKRANRHPKPYIDYLDKQEELLFQDFWNSHLWRLTSAAALGHTAEESLIPYQEPLNAWRKNILKTADSPLAKAFLILQKTIQPLKPQQTIALLESFRSFDKLTQPLYGHYRGLRITGDKQLERDLAAAFYPKNGYGYGRSWAYRQSCVQGSIFKLVTGYQALVERYQMLQSKGENTSYLNPLEIIDQAHKEGEQWYVGYTLDKQPIPQMYKSGKLLRSLSRNIGRVDLPRAIETSSNPYFMLLATDHISTPSALIDAAKAFSYGAPTGIDLPGEIGGHLPDDLEENQTGLYSFAIGQHAFVVTPLQTAVMLSTILNGGTVLKPQIVHLSAGAMPLREDAFIAHGLHFPYKESLEMAGLDFPLFAAASKGFAQNQIVPVQPSVKRRLFFPNEVRTVLLDAMERVAHHYQTQGLESLRQLFQSDPTAVPALVNLKGDLVGKTSTGESTERLSLERLTGTQTYNHVWFGTASFDKSQPTSFVARDRFGKPELVVLVYLRFGGLGKEAAPIAAQMITKWREIKAHAPQ